MRYARLPPSRRRAPPSTATLVVAGGEQRIVRAVGVEAGLHQLLEERVRDIVVASSAGAVDRSTVSGEGRLNVALAHRREEQSTPMSPARHNERMAVL